MDNNVVKMLAKKLGINTQAVEQIMDNQVNANVQAKTAHNLDRD